MKKLLIVDDEEMIIKSIKMILKEYGIDVTGYSNSQEGVISAIEETYDLILVDIRMPDLNGAEFTKKVKSEKPESKIMVITAFPQDPLAQEALDAGAFTLLKKPFEIVKILSYFKEADKE